MIWINFKVKIDGIFLKKKKDMIYIDLIVILIFFVVVYLVFLNI